MKKEITKRDFELIIKKIGTIHDVDTASQSLFEIAKQMVSDENDIWQEFHDKRMKEHGKKQAIEFSKWQRNNTEKYKTSEQLYDKFNNENNRN